jgi:ribosomal protein S18 acetylase RimI-like enzyme
LPPVVARFEPPANDGLRAAIAEFDCVKILHDGQEDAGEVMVREFLRSGAYEEAAASGTTTTYMVADPEGVPRKVIGYVTLSLTQIRLSSGEVKQTEELAAVHRSDFGAIRIAMIGVGREFAGRGYGKLLVDTVIQHTARMSRDVSVRFIVADAVDTQLDWYKRQDFVENNSDAERDRLRQLAERTGVRATSVRLDLGPDPRVLLETSLEPA